MKCSNCQYDNPDGMKFCVKCANPLNLRCSDCGFENPPESSFCGQCATSLKEQSAYSESIDIDNDKQFIPPANGREKPEGERRQLTVMFSDLVGSTILSEQLDPEELREIIQDYQKVCAKVISRYDGHIAKYLGDGILVYFGYPLAHEDDAHRAVRTGLEIVDEIKNLSSHLQKNIDVSIAVRIGIHTGLVVVGEMGAGETLEQMAIVGETPNIAARLQELTESNSVVVSSTTYKLIQGYFIFKEMGPQNLKGISQPMELYKAIQETGVQSRLDIAAPKGLTPLVGREQEIQFLLERWEQVKEGTGQVVLLSGEAGVGKSRLLKVLEDHLAEDPHIRIESRCSPYYQNSSFYPLIDHLQRMLRFNKEDSPEKKLSKLESALEQYGFPTEEMVPLYSSLLMLPLNDRYTPLTLSPKKQKQKTLEAFLSWLMKEAEKQPVFRIVEDLQWADPSTLEYLSLLIEQVSTIPVFALFTYRPDFNMQWSMHSHMNQITLNRLDRKHSKLMIEGVAGGKVMPLEVVEQIVEKTDGVPLFVEELAKMVIDSGLLIENNGGYELKGPLPPLAIPTTLQDSLMARLDRLEAVKEVAQLASTIGREFTYELLQAVSSLDETTLQNELSKLVEAEILYQRGIAPNSIYFFKHALIQDAAYESLLKKKRNHYHQMIAKVLEERFLETTETHPEILAYHYTESGLVENAIPYWQKAGQIAIERSANVEAIGHLTKGLELIKTLPDTTERTELELKLQVALGSPIRITKGYATPELEKIYARSQELCEQIGQTPQQFSVLRGLCGFYLARAELIKAHELANQYMAQTQSLKDDTSLQIESKYLIGATSFCIGKLDLSRENTEQGIALYNPQKHGSPASLYAQDPGVGCSFWLSWALWYLGYPDQALSRSLEALKLAQKLSHPFSLALAYNSVASIHQYRREGEAALEASENAISLSLEGDFGFMLPLGNILHGWSNVGREKEEEGIKEMRQGIDSWRKIGVELYLTCWLGILAEAYMKTGMKEEALTVLGEAQEVASKNGELFYEAELYRLKGELVLAISKDNQDEAETCFLKAIEISKHQKAKSLELRAVMSLSQLYSKLDRQEDAQQMLEEIYSWFTEGFDTPDLKEAKELLEQFSSKE